MDLPAMDLPLFGQDEFIPPMASRSPPTPPERKISLIISKTKTDPKDQCDRCHCQFGEKQCASCHAVSYCSRKCQTEAWKTHKAACKQIKALNAELAETVSVMLAGTTEEEFMQSPSVREGRFRWYDTARYEGLLDGPIPRPSDPKLRYFTIRHDLIKFYLEVAYASRHITGTKFNGRTAFRYNEIANTYLILFD